MILPPDLDAAIRRLWAESALVERIAIQADAPDGAYLAGDPGCSRIYVGAVRRCREAREELAAAYGRARLAE